MHNRSINVKTEEYAAASICKAAWGRISSIEQPDGTLKYRWDLAHDQLSVTKPDCPNLIASLPPVQSTGETKFDTYFNYLYLAVPTDGPDQKEALE
jgi:hypothetical protein